MKYPFWKEKRGFYTWFFESERAIGWGWDRRIFLWRVPLLRVIIICYHG
jgi:hypothetical protein